MRQQLKLQKWDEVATKYELDKCSADFQDVEFDILLHHKSEPDYQLPSFFRRLEPPQVDHGSTKEFVKSISESAVVADANSYIVAEVNLRNSRLDVIAKVFQMERLMTFLLMRARSFPTAVSNSDNIDIGNVVCALVLMTPNNASNVVTNTIVEMLQKHPTALQ